jgi:hypothetical protein
MSNEITNEVVNEIVKVKKIYKSKEKDNEKQYNRNYYLKNRENRLIYSKQKKQCHVCNCLISSSNFSEHTKSNKHLKNLEK